MIKHNMMALKTMAGTMICGVSLVFFAYGAGLISRSWGWWQL